MKMLFVEKIKNTDKIQKTAIISSIIIAAICILQINVLNTYSEPVVYTLQDKTVDLNINCPVTDTVISFTPEQSRMKNIRFILSQIPSDGSGTIEIQLRHNEKLLYRGLRNCSDIKAGEWTGFGANIVLDTDEIYELHINISGTNLAEEARLCCYSETENQFIPLVSIGYSENLSIQDKILTSLFVLMVCAGVVHAILCAGTYKAKVQKLVIKLHSQRLQNVGIVSVLAFFVTYLAIELSELAIAHTVKWIISLIVFGTTCWLENHWERVKQKINKGRNVTVLLLLSAWTAFSLVGSRCLIYPVNRHLTVGSVLLFLITVVLMLPVAICILIKTEEFCHQKIEKKKRIPWDFVIATIVVILLSYLYFIRAFNPAISSPDTQHCMYYALNAIRGIDDWHPAFYILWLKAIVKIIPSARAVVAVQYVFFAYVLLRGFLFLYEKGMPKKVLYGAMLFTVLNCGNIVHMTTIWKDIPYTLSITWLTILVAILLFGEKERKVYLYIELAVALVWTCFFRQAGIVPFLIVGFALVVVFQKNRKIWSSVLMAVCMALIIKFPIYHHYEIRTDHGGGVYIGLGQDIMGVYYNGGELSEDALGMVEVLSKSDMANYGYSPYWAGSSYDLDVTKVQFIKAYMDTFIKNPILMTRNILCRMDAVWDIFLGENGTLGCVGHTGTMDGSKEKWADLWGKRENNFITERVQEWVSYSVNKPILNVIEWRSGIWFLLFLFAMGVCAYKRRLKKAILLFIPCLSHVLSLILSTGWSDFRYFWPINLMAMFVFTTVMTLKSEEA